MEPFILFGLILACGLAFVNGLNDASHSIATVIATRAISPAKAVFLTALCNMIGPFLFTTAVAATIGTGILAGTALTPLTIIVAMISAIFLIFAATRAGLPLSSSNAMVGGLLGAGVAGFGLSVVLLPPPSMVISVVLAGCAGAAAGAGVLGLVTRSLDGPVRYGMLLGALCGAAVAIPVLMIAGLIHLSGLLAVVLFIVISPVFGMTVAFLIDIAYVRLFMHARQSRMRRTSQPLHVLACLLQATAHGGNDGQNSVGLMTALLVAAGVLGSFVVPAWVILLAAVSIGLGTCFGGWEVVERMARGITRIRPYQGFCAATASSGTLVMVTLFGIPVSSTHAINGAIVGVGATRGKSAVHWEAVREMVTAWIITIPVAFACSFALYRILLAVVPVI